MSTTFAISRIGLDDQGRIATVRWGRVDIDTNTWATPEVQSPVSEVVNALGAGNPVFALFPTPRGHVPGPQFTIVPVGRRREGIALAPSTRRADRHRTVHEMDRLGH